MGETGGMAGGTAQKRAHESADSGDSKHAKQMKPDLAVKENRGPD